MNSDEEEYMAEQVVLSKIKTFISHKIFQRRFQDEYEVIA